MNKKEERELIYNKFGGSCAYCGVDLQKGWHVDELLPVRRNMKWNKDKTKYVHDGTYEHPERLHIDNQMPSCPSCNINKHSMSLEDFRNLIKGFVVSLNRDSTQYKIAKRYGLVFEADVDIEFYFEKWNRLTPQNK
ncbi:MAG: HNH endonuclease signature motif containing protein [Candidatus Heimdallarchaeaceae archaeon]